MVNRSNKIQITHDALFYLGMALVTFDSFPFNKYGLGSAKPLSIIPLFAYLVLMILRRGKVWINRGDKIIILTGLLLILQSFIFGWFDYKDLGGFRMTVNMFATFYVTILSFSSYMSNATRDKIIIMLKWILLSFKISLVFGVIELLYFKVVHVDFLRAFVECFVRDGVYLDVGYVQFNFGERGNASVMLGIVLPLTIFLLKKLKYSFKTSEKCWIILLYVISIFTYSTNYLIIVSVLAISLMIFEQGNSNKLFIVILFFIILILLLMPCVIESPQFRNYVLASDSRVLRILVDFNSIVEDNSIQTRLGQAYICVLSFAKHPFTGYGWGYFIHAMRDNYNDVLPILRSYELSLQAQGTQLQTFGFIFSIIAEGGLVGFLFAGSLLKKFRKIDKSLIPFIIVFLVECTQNVFVYWISMVLVYCLVTNEKINNYIKTKGNLL